MSGNRFMNMHLVEECLKFSLSQGSEIRKGFSGDLLCQKPSKDPHCFIFKLNFFCLSDCMCLIRVCWKNKYFC